MTAIAEREPKTNRKPRDEQQTIPGTEPKRIEAIETRARQFRNSRQDWQDAQEVMEKDHDALLASLKAHGVETYSYEDGDGELIEVFIEHTDERARVRKKKKPKA